MLIVGQVRVPGMGSCSLRAPEQPCRAWGLPCPGGQQSWVLLAAWKGNSVLGTGEKPLGAAVGGM